MFFPEGFAEPDSDMPFLARLEALAPPGRQAAAAAAAALGAGDLVIVVDGGAGRGAGRGFFLGVAALATAATVNTSIMWGRGLTCFSVTADRALTLCAAGAPDAGITSLKSPGHVMPAMIGYRGREHRASADIALDLVRCLTEYDVAAWTDILDDAGDVASAGYCRTLAARLGVPCLDVLETFGAEALG
jgi:3,4-dihydroxy-2-butanone 4-phosphate synthase